jgi:hypothetical protein
MIIIATKLSRMHCAWFTQISFQSETDGSRAR